MTMIEMIVLMTAVAAMLGLSAVMLQLLLKLEGSSRARLDGAAAMARLAEQFRRDVHAARSARLTSPPAGAPGRRGLAVEPGPEQAIEYRVTRDGKIVRLESRKGSLVRRESYDIPRSGPITLALLQQSGRSFAALSVDRRLGPLGTDPPRLFEVLALVGKNKDRISHTAGAGGAKP
jgi:hypothetical protein